MHLKNNEYLSIVPINMAYSFLLKFVIFRYACFLSQIERRTESINAPCQTLKTKVVFYKAISLQHHQGPCY